MRYRTRLLLSIIALVTVTVGILTAITYLHARDMVFEQIRSTVLSIATAAAQHVDGDLHEQIREPGQESSDAYLALEAVLRAVRDAQRREDVHVAFIYTVRPGPNPQDPWIYVVDAV